MELVLATSNMNKLREFRQMLGDIDVHLLSLADFPGHPAIVEDGLSFAENALKKARAIAAHTGQVTIADDSGLEVDYLKGLPGIYSARFAGDDADDEKNNAKLLAALEGVPAEKRGARFTCVIALVARGNAERVVEGVYRGRIITEARGARGFGYDPVFLDEGSGLTYAEMEPAYKNRISHRSRAIQELRKVLPDFLAALPPA